MNVDRVEIVCRDETIAVHPRSYERADFIYNPLHYLALLEQKTKALDRAAPLDDWRLADCVYRLRRRYADFLANAAVTRCQVGIAPEGSASVAKIQGHIRPRYMCESNYQPDIIVCR